MCVLDQRRVGTRHFERQVHSRPERLLLLIFEIRQTPVRIVLALVLGTHHVDVYGDVLVGEYIGHGHVEAFEYALLALQSQVLGPLGVA